MDFQLSDEQQLFQATIREFADKEIRPVAREWDAEGRYPHEIVEKMKTHKDKVDPEDDAVNYVRSRELKKSALNFSCLIYPLCRNCGPSATSSCLCSSARPQTLSSRNSQPR